MALNFTDGIESLVIRYLTGVGSLTQPTGPLKVRAVTALGSESAAGTELVGTGYTAGGVSASFGTESGGVVSNTAIVGWTNSGGTSWPAVVGYELWDSAATPVRVAWTKSGEVTSQTVAAGNQLQFPVGTLTLSAD